MKIGNIEFEKGIFLAPMASITDVGFRSVCTDFGAELTYTEMISAKGVYYGNEKAEKRLKFEPNCKRRAIQLFGNDADIMAKVVESFGTTYDIIDLNMGCPAPKIFKNDEGCALMGNIENARDVITKCVKVSKVPITVKFRSGINDSCINAVEFAKMCESAGASAICIHARTREQFYSGKVNYDLVKSIVNAVNIPVIGSGDIVDIETYNKMLECGVSAVMIARGALGNPAIFSILSGKNPPYSKFEAIQKHIEILKKYFNDDYLVKYMRKHFIWYANGIKNNRQLKLSLAKCENLQTSLNQLKEALAN